MEQTILKITEEEFDEKYRPIDNLFDTNAGWGGKLFETYDDELDYCFELSKKENRVWTIIECDDVLFDDDDDEDDDDDDDDDDDEEEYAPMCLYIVSGFHYVNRIGFLVTELPYSGEIEIKLT